MARRRTILLVEDNEQNRELVEYLLEMAGYAVFSAENPTDARILFRTKEPDLVLMDMHLPGRDGLSVVQEFRLDPVGGKTPIVALTAYAMRGDKERFLAGGCTGYIAKPIDTKTFVSEVEKYLPKKP
ncbi:MAG: response regulator [Acidobacteria bacterium]|nr:response regulator [Acidobacteriota bacterium]MCK6684107.1 response regulator [Thermoanaerobaculia bacterium]